MPKSRPSSPPRTPLANGLGLTLNDKEARDVSMPHTIVDEGKKVPYGSGFYVPPPGFPASTFTEQASMHITSLDDTVTIEMPDRRAASSNTMLQGLAEDGIARTQPVPPSKTTYRSHRSAATRRSQLRQRQRQRCCSYDMPRARSAPSPNGTLILWTGLAVLLAAAQSILRERYEHEPASQALGLASLVLTLFSALISGIALLVATNANPHGRASTRLSTRKKSFATSLLIGLCNACGVCVCLAAALQLASVVTYAMRSLDPHARYSVCIALAASLLVASVGIGHQLYLDGQLCCSGKRRALRKQRGAKGRHPSLADARTPSACRSSVSSHGGRYVPDYGLDSDSESDYMKRGIQHAHADWTDRMLDGLIHSPLLDELKLHR